MTDPQSPNDPHDPSHWGLETLLCEELSLLRSEMPAPKITGHERDFSERLRQSARQAAAEAKERWLGVTAKNGGAPWRPGPVPPEVYLRLFDANFTALSLSGGGIRSASFCLGILQAAAKGSKLPLDRFDYLSTVSGGGYIGSWLSAWCARTGMNIAAVAAELQGPVEPREVTNLRDFTSYITPRRGLASSDSWAGIATICRNLVLNWLLFLPLFLFLVWLPKVTVLVFEWGQAMIDGWAPWMFTAACLLYFAAMLFVSRQLAMQSSPPKPAKHMHGPPTFGAGQGAFLALGLAPLLLAAGISSVVMVHASFHIVSLRVFSAFGAVGAAIWALSAFLTRRWRLDRMVVARGAAGIGFGIASALVVLLLQDMQDDRHIVVFGIAGFFAAHLAGNILFAGLTGRIVFDNDAALEWAARAGGTGMLVGLAWTVYATIVLWDPQFDWPGPQTGSLVHQLVHGALQAAGGVAGIGAALFGKSKSTSAAGKIKAGPRNGFDWSKIANIGALLFFAVLLFELSRLFDRVVLQTPLAELAHYKSLPDYWLMLALVPLMVLPLWTGVASCFVNVNKFSMHAFYRNRLIRAYLGASNGTRRPSAFTGFDRADNITMDSLRSPGAAPLHIVNTALNLVHGKRLAWQERKASSFSISTVAAGNPHLGYRPAGKYGGGISLGTAMAISGAAVSPNMGYHSSPTLAFIMTLFNVRLGWWLGNPAKGAWTRWGPLQSFGPFLSELLGLTDDESRYVYLSDGGHFENLGIYELLQRRCRTIVAVDASCDPDFQFEDLGNAIRKARIDFGTEIKFKAPLPPGPQLQPTRLGLVNRPSPPAASPYFAVADIYYPEKTVGMLIYIKAAIHGDEPEDIGSYAAVNPSFPHESTADQFFTESQFESYRRLGYHVGQQIF